MNLYQISTGCYSSFEHCILENEKYYSPIEFANLCRKIAENITRSDNYLYNHEEIQQALINNYGFKKSKIVCCHFWDYAYEFKDDEDNQGFHPSEI
jgi:hypothetical protein